MMTVRRSSLRRSVAAFAVAVCLPMLAACGEDEKPEIKRAPVSETPSASESPSASETPEPESAKAFIRRWQELSDEMQVSGDTGEFRKLSTRLCESCKSLADRVDQIYEAGGQVEYAGSKLLSITRTGGSKHMPQFEMERRAGRVSVTESAGAKPIKGAPVTDTYVIVLKHQGNSWKVNTLLRRAE